MQELSLMYQRSITWSEREFESLLRNLRIPRLGLNCASLMSEVSFQSSGLFFTEEVSHDNNDGSLPGNWTSSPWTTVSLEYYPLDNHKLDSLRG